MGKIPLVDLKAQYVGIQNEIDEAIRRCIDRSSFILGPEVEAFEQEFAAFCGVQRAVGVDSGTAALHLALVILGVGAGDEVITTTHTFIATAEVISLVGATPVLVDIAPRTFNMDPALLEAAITPRTKAVIAVHLAGQPADMDAILTVAERYGLPVIEDAAQAHGAIYRGRPVGTMGDLACFSFYPGKNLGAYGDGGALVTDRSDYADKARLLRNHGRLSKYEHLVTGYGYRLDALQAAILRAKLPHLAAWNEQRRGHAARYNALLADSGAVAPYEPPDVRSVYHLYMVRVPRRDDVAVLMKQAGIEVGVHYPIPLHRQPVYASLGYGEGSFPLAEAAAREVLSLPMYPELTEEQVARVAQALRQALAAVGGR
ncbi:MAG: DegT/DnrJ/EryC1/StrS family aminotransferase [Chloroflexi bacterium]|nr:DegT/DnrJ/EryC1/StrS family aminotransferase [Chloroflexota bacterium]